MPDSRDFLAGFGLRNGLIIDGYQIININIDHNQIVRYRQYEYPIVLTLKPINYEPPILSADVIASFDRTLHSIIDRVLIINSHYGNPYQCNINFISSHRDASNNVIINLLGHSQRV